MATVHPTQNSLACAGKPFWKSSLAENCGTSCDPRHTAGGHHSANPPRSRVRAAAPMRRSPDGACLSSRFQPDLLSRRMSECRFRFPISTPRIVTNPCARAGARFWLAISIRGGRFWRRFPGGGEHSAVGRRSSMTTPSRRPNGRRASSTRSWTGSGGIVMSGRRPPIKGYFQRCADRGCGHVFGLSVRRIGSAGPDVVR